MAENPEPITDAGGRREVASEPFFYRLFADTDGAYEIEVLRNNSAAYYLVSHRLTDDEVAKYRRRGKRFLAALANRVR